MSDNTKTITFWNFLKETTIEIPIIQRDYAQGRLGKENLRKNFLADLQKALDNEHPYKDTPMKLDFVYGSAENGKLNPLDGQQRLTTLWLLHWYIALRAGELSEDNCKVFRKFTYETRISSREFCQNLCIPEYFKNFDGKDIVGFITKQTWFYSAWKQDPTIQSMLRMLGGTKVTNKKNEDIVDGIEELFKCPSECFIDGKVYCFFKRYWEKLTSDNVPVVFYHLPMKDFGLSDDLYIKMNARGKQLTSFENFKADLIGYITNQAEDNHESGWNGLLDAKNGIPIKLDTDWTDIFWKNKSKGLTDNESKTRKSNQIDEIYFAFFNRFFWNELFIAKKSNNQEFILDIGKGDENSTQGNNNSSYKYLNNSEHNNDVTIAYNGLDVYRYYDGIIPLSFFQKIKRVLDNYFVYQKDKNCLPKCTWDTSFRFIPQYNEDDSGNNIEIENNAQNKILSVSTLNQVQRVVFFAVCKYFGHDDNVSDSQESLKQWMRVVWNLVSGEDQNGRPEIRSTSALRAAIKFIDSLESHKVYKSLRDYEITLGNSSFDERCKEEIAKAKQILDEDGNLREYEGSCKKKDDSDYQTWEEIIIDAENYAFFKGAIRFLFTKKDIGDDWEHFDTKWINAQKYFYKNGVKDEHKVLLTRSLVVQCDNWSEQLYDKQIFNPKNTTWKWILTADNWIAPIHNILMGSNISATNENNDENVKKYVTPILKELPIDYLINNEPDGRFRWLGERLCFYKPYGHDMATLDWKNWRRNEILSSLLNYKTITTDAQMGDSKFFWGWNINFSYKNHIFQWWGNPNKKELDVYLMEQKENRIKYKERCSPTTHKSTDEDTHYCFRVDMNTTLDNFIEKLDCLIAQAYSERSDKACCTDCQDKICE